MQRLRIHGLSMLTVLVMVLGAAAAHATPVTIDFDTLPGGDTVASGTQIGNQYASLGVTFSLFENGTFVGNPVAAGLGGNSLYNTAGLFRPLADVLLIDFTTPVADVSFMTYGLLGDDTSFDFLAYDAGGHLLRTITNHNGGWMNVSFTGTPVARIEARQGSDWGTYLLDNLRFDPVVAPVPEPGTLMLMGTGLVGLLGYGWRKRRQTT